MPTLSSFAQGLGVWHAAALDTSPRPVWSSGHAALDVALPGGGWPVGALVEILQAPDVHLEWQLLLPALRGRLAAHRGPLVLIDPPALPLAPALAAQGLPTDRLVIVQTAVAGAQARGRAPAGPALAAWACEQALRCAQVAGVLAWWAAGPSLSAGEGAGRRVPALAGGATAGRRLHLAAQAHKVPLFVFRSVAWHPGGASADAGGSPAELRLGLVPGPVDPLQMQVEVLKRRGPPLATPLQVPIEAAAIRALRPLIEARNLRPGLQAQGTRPLPTVAALQAPRPLHASPARRSRDVVDRPVAA